MKLLINHGRRKEKKGGCLRIGCTGFIAIFLLGLVGAILAPKWEKEDIEKCNNGVVESCENLLEGQNDVSDEITNTEFKDAFLEKKKGIEEKIRIKEEKKAKAAEEQAKQDALIVKRRICIEILKATLKDPSSFKEVNSILDQMETGIIVYSATNSFGGRIQERFDCNQ